VPFRLLVEKNFRFDVVAHKSKAPVCFAPSERLNRTASLEFAVVIDPDERTVSTGVHKNSATGRVNRLAQLGMHSGQELEQFFMAVGVLKCLIRFATISS